MLTCSAMLGSEAFATEIRAVMVAVELDQIAVTFADRPVKLRTERRESGAPGAQGPGVLGAEIVRAVSQYGSVEERGETMNSVAHIEPVLSRRPREDHGAAGECGSGNLVHGTERVAQSRAVLVGTKDGTEPADDPIQAVKLAQALWRIRRDAGRRSAFDVSRRRAAGGDA
jgi:hypothetical protein